MDFSILATPAMVKAEAARRIEQDWPLWRQLNITRAGGEPLDQMSAAIDAIRAASNALEQSKPIPANFSADRHWPAA